MHIPPPLIAAAIAGLMVLIDRIPALRALDFDAPIVLPILLGVAGIAVAVAGVVQFRLQRTTVNPIKIDTASALVTTGVFRWTRNPMYLGLLCFLLGVGMKLGNIAVILVALLFVPVITTLQIRPEEAAMTKLFGDAFEAYRARTRRWL
ncbi:MAG: isoprenylcysteine carboxylmethyltransferase family protein [Pseudomonadota bacterium]